MGVPEGTSCVRSAVRIHQHCVRPCAEEEDGIDDASRGYAQAESAADVTRIGVGRSQERPPLAGGRTSALELTIGGA